MPILTCGHSNRSLAQLVDLLTRAEVETLVDVRSRPQSRYCPHFNKASLAAELPANNIEYLWKGRHLGGLDGNTDYEENIMELVLMSRDHVVAIMCSEGPVKNCHRRYMLTPDLQAQGAEVYDLDWEGNIVPAPPLARKEVHDTPEDATLF